MKRSRPMMAVLVAAVVTTECTGTQGGVGSPTATIGVAAPSASATPEPFSPPASTTTSTPEPSSPPASTTTSTAASASSNDPATTAESSAAAEGAPASLVWTNDDHQVLGQPEAIGEDLVAAYTRNVEGALLMSAFAVTTGDLAWDVIVSPGAEAPGVSLSPLVVGHAVIVLTPPDGSAGRDAAYVVALDGTSGKVRAISSDTYNVADRPYDCEGAICVGVWENDRSVTKLFDPATGAVTAAPAGNAIPDDARTIGPQGLLSIHPSDQPERLARWVDGTVIWDRPFLDVFGAGYSSNWGWIFYYNEALDLWVGAVGQERAEDGAITLGTERQWGIEAATGAVVWSEIGADNSCVYALDQILPDLPLTVRCRWSADAALDSDFNFTTGTVSLEGFDTATGKTTWSVPLAPLASTSGEDFSNSISATIDGRLVVAGATDTVVVDPVTGEVSPAAGVTGLCVADVWESLPTFEYDYGRGDGAHDEYLGGQAIDACDSDGASVPLTAAPPADVGLPLGGLLLLTTTAGLQAFRIG